MPILHDPSSRIAKLSYMNRQFQNHAENVLSTSVSQNKYVQSIYDIDILNMTQVDAQDWQFLSHFIGDRTSSR